MTSIACTTTNDEGAFSLGFDTGFDSLFSGRVTFPAPPGYLAAIHPYD